MGKIIDLTGKKFGKLLVLGTSEERIRNVLSWGCVCDCGNTKTVAGPDLRMGDVQSCGCMRWQGTKKDVTGQKRGWLTALSSTGEKCSNGDYKWNFMCDCGNTRVMSLGAFGSKESLSCKACSKDRMSKLHKTHGFEKSHKTYKSWCKIKERCFNVNCPDYKDYGAKGITVHQSFLDDFMNFYNEVGEAPKDGQRWSIDRIDHTKNYEPGNLRWATDFEQARNKGMNVKNTSGVTGVHWDEKKSSDGMYSTTYAVACWRELVNGEMKRCKKSFPVKTYGLLPAFALAVQYRKDQIKRLNELGYGYSDNHGE